MKRRRTLRRAGAGLLSALSLVIINSGMTCPIGGDPNANPIVPPGNRPPRIVITSIVTDFGNNFAEVGETVAINFTGEDEEDASVVRVFASLSGNPAPAEEIPILGGFPIGPGSASGTALWDTTGVAPSSYNVFAEIDDRTLDPFTGTGNPPVRVTTFEPLQLGPPGSTPSNSPPQIVFISPLANLSLSANDQLTLQYIYADVDSTATVTLLLDKDLNPTNDDINNPGDPLNPATNIIVLPSAPRDPNDPTFDGDPPPPDDPADPPVAPDSLEIRTNPRILPATTPGVLPFPGAPIAGSQVSYIFTVNFSQIPPGDEQYFIRATITDGDSVTHRYSVGSINITGSAAGVVNVRELGFSLSGARFHGFQRFANLGSSILRLGDLDRDGNADFMVASRHASPLGRQFAGAAALVFGRKKTPFPSDTDADGRPDGGVLDEDDMVVNFPEPLPVFPDPYEPRNVGRFGGENSIESVGSRPTSFFRGVIYRMPNARRPAFAPDEILIENPAERPPSDAHAGLTSITSLNMTGNDELMLMEPDEVDPLPDLVFGLPFVSAPLDFHDDDPADGCDESLYSGVMGVGPTYPHSMRCDDMPANDDLQNHSEEIFDTGLVIIVDATNDTVNEHTQGVDAGMAGQFDQSNMKPINDEGVILGDEQIPEGMRFRGGWHDDDFVAPLFSSVTGYGNTVAAIDSIDGNQADELVISIPLQTGLAGAMTGAIQVWLSGDMTAADRYTDNVRSLPSYATGQQICSAGPCTTVMPTTCIRCFRTPPVSFFVEGSMMGDMLGWAGRGGDLNGDSNGDITAGAPGADRGGFLDNGVVYVLYTLGSGFSGQPIDDVVPMLQLWGTHDFDGFGRTQSAVSINGDPKDDFALGAPGFDDNTIGADSGFAGVVFGPGSIGTHMVSAIGTPALPGVRFVGARPGARAGHHVGSAGDFNGDGFGELLVTSPGEVRCRDANGTFTIAVGGVCPPGTVLHQGTTYLIFGGPHLNSSETGRNPNQFTLSEVGGPALPGIVFVGRTLPGTTGLPEVLAPLDIAEGLGDIDGDGFADIGLGATKADFVANSDDPVNREVDAGEFYIVYGNNFGSNNPSTFP